MRRPQKSRGYRAAYRPKPYVGNRRRYVRNIILALLLIGVLLYGTLLGIVVAGMGSRLPEEDNRKPAAMVILGCQVKPWGPSILLQDRLDTALAYLEENPELPVIVSGAQGPDEHISEAQAMADYLIEQGIDESRIWLEDQSHNTWQNLNYTRQEMAAHDLKPEEGVVIVSNGFHLSRVRMLWERVTGTTPYTLSAPSSHIPSRLKMYIREPFALLKSFLFDR